MAAEHLPTMRHHPRIGYTFIPGLKKFHVGQGGKFLLRTNAMGFRADREFLAERTPGKRRALLFGDSQSDGLGLPNPKRYSDLAEQRVPDLEIYNMAVTGTGTDQQLMTYREFGAALPHDLVILGLFVDNIERNSLKCLKWADPQGNAMYYGKPYFERREGELVLHGVPVPERPWTDETLPAELRDNMVAAEAVRAAELGGAKALARRLLPAAVRQPLASLLRRFVRRRRLRPGYDRPDHPQWLLMRAILEQWIAESPVPVLILTLPAMHFALEPNDARPCQQRFAELARATGCTVLDPLPAMLRLGVEERKALWNFESGHIHEAGHRFIADLLAPVVAAMLPPAQAETAPAQALAG